MPADLGELANLATALTLVVALAFGIGQLRQQDRTGHEATMAVLSQLHSGDYNRALRLVLELPKDFAVDLAPLPPEQREAVYRIDQQRENLGVSVATGVLDVDTVRAAFAPGVLALWRRLEPYVQAQRRHHPGFGRHFEALAAQMGEAPRGPPGHRAG